MGAQPSQAGVSTITDELRAFVDEAPYERGPILAFLNAVAESLPAGAVVIDINAGDAPYAELFGHCEYVTTEWDGFISGGVREVDHVAPPEALPRTDASGDAVLLTDVLDRTSDPAAVVREAARILRPDGAVFLTVPFVRQLTEPPRSDLWRLTPASLQHLLTEAGFVDPRVEPLCDCFTTVAHLLCTLGAVMGRADDGQDGDRERAAELLAELAGPVGALAWLDVERSFPLSWTAKARRA